ncbi:hypothetical protein TrCOL_g13285 [Triparma columacea]|uniref:Sugar phosphate transporter domain-containing protein n=1 Tax=Triparma columacea TaxID=722753 RepID=A0A9W7L1F1_9STRA|nr:hypothetical protein TrCOL_g13285 [Triparma columacea]
MKTPMSPISSILPMSSSLNPSASMNFMKYFPLIILWYASALVTVTTSNILLSTSDTSPLLLTYLQLSLSTLAQYNFFQPLKDVLPNARREKGLGFSRFFPPLTLPPSRFLGNKERRQLSISTLSFLLGFLLTNYTFYLTSAAVTETVKTTEPVSTAVMSWWGGLEVFDLKDIASMGVTMLGVKLAVSTASAGGGAGGGAAGGTSYLAICAVICSNFAFSSRSVAMGKIRKSMDSKGEGVNGREIFYRMTHQGAVLLTPLVGIWGIWRLVKGWGSEEGLLQGVAAVRVIYTPLLTVLNVSLWLVYNSASTNLLTLLPPTTHALLNVLRRLVIIVGTSWWFRVAVLAEMGAKGWAGVLIAIVGMAAFKVGRVGGKESVRGKKVWL